MNKPEMNTPAIVSATMSDSLESKSPLNHPQDVFFTKSRLYHHFKIWQTFCVYFLFYTILTTFISGSCLFLGSIRGWVLSTHALALFVSCIIVGAVIGSFIALHQTLSIYFSSRSEHNKSQSP